MTNRRHNLFLALQPDAEAILSISRLMGQLGREHRLGGRTISRECLHISLVSLGGDSIPLWLLERTNAALSTVTMPPFVVAFNRVTSWKPRIGQRSRPLVLLGDEGVIGVDMLRAQIRAALAEASLKPRRFENEIPHLTLAYGELEPAEEIVALVRWTVREFVLVDSLVGEGRHVILQRWPLVPADATLSDRLSST